MSVEEFAKKFQEREFTQSFSTGAQRSADSNHLDFTSLPWIGIIAAARTAHEVGTKYGRFNYAKGMPIHDALNHVIKHYAMYLLGDRSEPHLAHAAWGALFICQSETLHPELNQAHLLGSGATLPDAMLELLDREGVQKAKDRSEGKFDALGAWKLEDLPEIKRILEQRSQAT